MASPTHVAVRRLCHLVRYVHTYQNAGLQLRVHGNTNSRTFLNSIPILTGILGKSPGPTEQKDSSIIGFADANFTPVDEPKRKSTSGYAILFLACLVSWRSKLQPIVTTGTMQAELVASALAADEGIYIKRLISDLLLTIYGKEILKKVLLFGDNASCIFTANNPVTLVKARHLAMRYFKAREYIELGDLVFEYLRGNMNPADFFTKALSFEVLRKHLLALGFVFDVNKT